jgi:hypothetical protein
MITDEIIDHGAAARIAADWHGGQGSGLYSLASTGTVSVNDAWRMLREIEDTQRRDRMTDGQYDQLSALAAYVKHWGPVYECVIFVGNGDSSYDEFEGIMYPDRSDGSMGWPDGADAAREYLLQWDNGDAIEPEDSDPTGNTGELSDYWDVPVSEDGDGEIPPLVAYVMTWHVGLSYAALYRLRQRQRD